MLSRCVRDSNPFAGEKLSGLENLRSAGGLVLGVHAGYQALMVMAMEAGAEIGGWLGDPNIQRQLFYPRRVFFLCFRVLKILAGVIVAGGYGMGSKENFDLVFEGIQKPDE